MALMANLPDLAAEVEAEAEAAFCKATEGGLKS
jgi:hypothetical protein